MPVSREIYKTTEQQASHIRQISGVYDMEQN